MGGCHCSTCSPSPWCVSLPAYLLVSSQQSSSSNSSDDEAGQEVGFKEEEKTQEEHDAHSEQKDQATKEAAKVPLQEAMEARKSDVGAPSETVEEKQPQFVTVGVTECTHPSANGNP